MVHEKCSPCNLFALVNFMGDTCSETLMYDNDWHYGFVVPWKRMSASFMRKMKNEERPICPERRFIVSSEILEVSKCPTKKDIYMYVK